MKHKDGKCVCWQTEPKPDWRDKKIAELEESKNLCRCVDEVRCEYRKRIAELEHMVEYHVQDKCRLNSVKTQKIVDLQAKLDAMPCYFGWFWNSVSNGETDCSTEYRHNTEKYCPACKAALNGEGNVKDDHKHVWLEPEPPMDDYEVGRTWCQDNGYDPYDYDGNLPTLYIRNDIADKRIAELERAVKDSVTLYESYRKQLDAVRGIPKRMSSELSTVGEKAFNNGWNALQGELQAALNGEDDAT